MAGGVLISTGMVIASFARTVVDMYVTIGVISGESSCSCTCPTLCWHLQLLARGVLLPMTWGVLEKRTVLEPLLSCCCRPSRGGGRGWTLGFVPRVILGTSSGLGPADHSASAAGPVASVRLGSLGR